MTVRSKRDVSIVVGLIFGLVMAIFLKFAADDELHCGIRGAWLCTIASLFERWRIFGLNPFILLFAALALSLVQLCIRQTWYGVSFRVTGTQIQGPSLFGTKTIDISDVLDVECQQKLFGYFAVVIFGLKNGRKVGFGSANLDDAEEFACRFPPTQPAAPATPPAT